MRPVSVAARIACAVFAVLVTVLLFIAPGCISSALANEQSSASEIVPSSVTDNLVRDSGNFSGMATEKEKLFAAVPLFETYTTRAGVRADWLWNRFRAQGRAAHEWPAFWREACTASNIPCTEDAWRKISPGTRITMPRSTDDMMRDLLAAQERLREELDKTGNKPQALNLNEEEIAKIKGEFAHSRAITFILGATAAIFFVGMLFIAAKNHRLEVENRNMRDERDRRDKEFRHIVDERDRLRGDVGRLIAHLSARTKGSRDEPLTPPRQS